MYFCDKEITIIMNLITVRNATKYGSNPFMGIEIFEIKKGNKTVIAGSTNKYLVDGQSGEAEAITLLAKKQEIDKEEFAKVYIDQIQSLFNLSKSGIRVFAYLLSALKINKGEVYINILRVMEFCKYKQRNQAYKGLAELINNNIIAMSKDPNIWYINPNIVFNGNRIAFLKEYNIINKPKKEPPKQINLFSNEEVQSNSEGTA